MVYMNLYFTNMKLTHRLLQSDLRIARGGGGDGNTFSSTGFDLEMTSQKELKEHLP